MKESPSAVRLALVGISGYGRIYLRQVEKCIADGRATLEAVCLINPEEEADACSRLRSRGTLIFSDWREMMAKCSGRVDLCLLPVPIHLHEQMTIRALECGMHVLVEKPLASSLSASEAIREAENRTARWVAVGFQDFYRPSTEVIRAALDAGRIGEIHTIAWKGLWPRSMAYFRRNNWAGRLALDGHTVLDSPLNNAFAHYLTLSFLLAGAGKVPMAFPEMVKAHLSRCYPIESFDTAKVEITCDTGVRIKAAATHCCATEQPLQLEVSGSEGWMLWKNHASARWSDGEETLIEGWHDCMAAMFRSVLARVSNRTARICTCLDALPQLSLIETLHARHEIATARHWEERTHENEVFRFLPGIENEFTQWIKDDWMAGKSSPRQRTRTASTLPA